MIIIFGKGKVGKGLNKLLNKLNINNILMDDQDYNTEKLNLAEKIIVSPGIKPSHKIYRNYGEKMLSELNFLGDIIKNEGLEDKIEFIAVTGTNGKSTSVHIMYNLFKGLFEELEVDIDVYLSGNFGTPLSETLCDIIDRKHEKNLVILECSSFMLYKLNNFNFDYSILTNLGVDHLDWHKDLDDYFDSKFNIIRYTKSCAVTNNECMRKYKEKLNKTDTKILNKNVRIKLYDTEFDLNKTQFLGKHNEGNWNAVYKIMLEYFNDKGIDWNEKIFWDIAKDIEPLKHRMRMVKEINGIKIYDDGICTSSQALNAALSCFEKKVVLIAGGYDKGEDYTWLSEELNKKVGFACLIGQTAKKFGKIFDKKDIKYKIFDSLDEAVYFAIKKAKELKLGNILFSPGSASFDMFRNVYDRCELFSKIIDKI